MIIIDQRKLRFLRAGRTITVLVARPYQPGRDYAAGVRHNRTLLRVQVLDVAEHPDGFKIAVRQLSGDTVRLLSRSRTRGYVTATVEAAALDPRVALRGGLVDEPEPIDEATLARYAALAVARDDRIRRERAAEQRERPTRRYASPSGLLPRAASRRL